MDTDKKQSHGQSHQICSLSSALLGRSDVALGWELHRQLWIDAQEGQQVGVLVRTQARQVGLLQRRAAGLRRLLLRRRRTRGADARPARRHSILAHAAQARLSTHIACRRQENHHGRYESEWHGGAATEL